MNNKRILANDLVPGSAMRPGALLRDELKAREMKQVELANALGIAKNVMSEIINGKRNMTSDLAVRLEEVLGIKAEFWMRHQVAYEIDKIRINKRKSAQKTRLSKKATRQPASI
ncbi:MAG TPA: HigA family addiction module antitoxin [Saprospiraceae bacterium]|nr:HigA family addiction module antitoxin [Saprospiraceae bacterium]